MTTFSFQCSPCLTSMQHDNRFTSSATTSAIVTSAVWRARCPSTWWSTSGTAPVNPTWAIPTTTRALITPAPPPPTRATRTDPAHRTWSVSHFFFLNLFLSCPFDFEERTKFAIVTSLKQTDTKASQLVSTLGRDGRLPSPSQGPALTLSMYNIRNKTKSYFHRFFFESVFHLSRSKSSAKCG